MFKAGMMMVARQASKIVRRHCDCCGDELDAHQAFSSGVCDRQRCREWKIAKVGTELLQRRRREILERLFDEQAGAVAAASAAVGGAPETVTRGTTQYQGAPLAPPDPARRERFEAHLRWLVEEAFAGPDPAADVAAARVGLEDEEPPVMRAACALCRGKCCERGGTTAMLDEADINRFRARDPEAAPEAIVAAYMAALPGDTVSGACVYLAATGCALPRAMRNDWCNASQCKERETLAAAIDSAGGGPVVMIADDAETESAGAVGGWSAATGLVRVPVIAPEPAAAGGGAAGAAGGGDTAGAGEDPA